MYYRRLPKFEHLAPKSIEEAVSLIQDHRRDGKIIAGGTIVIHQMKERVGVCKFLISLKSVQGMDRIRFDEKEGLRIGALTNLKSVAESEVVREKYKILADACKLLGTPQKRTMGTIGGNICCKFPTAETVPVLIALGAEVRIIGAEGERLVAVQDVNKSLKQGELLSEICIPALPAGTTGGYVKFATRDRFDYATASAAVAITSKNGSCEDIRIAIGGVAAKRAEKAESVMKGNKITKEIIDKVARTASEEVPCLL